MDEWSCSLTSSAATLTVNRITTQPSNTTVCQGSTAQFSVAGTPAANSYQWQVYKGELHSK